MSEFRWPLMQETLFLSDKLKLAKYILASSRFTQGEKVAEFEEQWSKWIGAKHSVFVSSGSTANFLLIAAIKDRFALKEKTKVLLPACTWVTTINPIIQLGFEPVFCDVNLNDFSFDLDNMWYLAKKHPDISVIFTTHLLGFPAPVEIYKNIFPEALFIDDVCESHGCKDESGKKIGSDSQGATFSFYYGHHMSTIEGGMISTNDVFLHDIMKMKRSHGMARNSVLASQYALNYPDIDRSFLFVTDGYNFRNTELGAILGISQLNKLDSFIENRRERFFEFRNIVNRYDHFYPIAFSEGNSSFCFPFICKTRSVRNKLIVLLRKHKIEYRPVVAGNLLRQPYLSGKYVIEREDLTKPLNVDILHENGIYIGNNQFVTRKDMFYLEGVLEEML